METRYIGFMCFHDMLGTPLSLVPTSKTGYPALDEKFPRKDQTVRTLQV